MERPHVGIGVFVWKNGKFLMGLRKGAHGEDTWAPPGGMLEQFESWEDCAKREVIEETGMKIKNCMFFAVTNDLYLDEGLHFVTIFISSDWASGIPRIIEPDKCKEWKWVSPAKMPKPLFTSIANLKRAKPELFK